jgi:urease accessory protein
MACMAAIPCEDDGWKARLRLAFMPGNGRTVLVENRHQGPLLVQRPLYPENEVCHVCILHPPGGVVGGDALNLQLHVGPDAHSLVTTPGATKFYRTDGRRAVQQNELRVEGGILEWFPQDAIVFPGARAQMATLVDLDATAGFIGWEITSLGLPTRHLRFNTGSLTTRFQISRGGRPLLRERLEINQKIGLDSMIGLRGYAVSGLLTAAGCKADMIRPLEALLPQGKSCLCGLTLLGEILVARYLGESTFEAREIFQKLWSWLRPVLYGRTACPPRIWNT